MDASIVIPSHDRAQRLGEVLRALDAQERISEVEVIVVRNGVSVAERPLEATKRDLRFRLRVIDIERASISKARNTGVAAAAAELVLFINDDIVPHNPRWLAGHLAAHSGDDRGLAVLGPVRFPEVPPPTRVMCWMERHGHMTAYQAPDESRPEMFYASNTSLRREDVLTAGGFDERFDGYGWEEYDLSLRLHEQGLRVRFLPELLAEHNHRYTLPESLERMERIGRASVVFSRKHAGRADLAVPTGSRLKIAAGVAATPVAERLMELTALPDRVYDKCLWLGHKAALARGFAEERRAG